MCPNMLNDKVKTASNILSSKQLSDLLQPTQIIQILPPGLQEIIREVLDTRCNKQMQVLTALEERTC